MNVKIRSLQAEEVLQAEQLFRHAFGTFIGLPDPSQFAGDAGYIPHRWQTDPAAAFAAEVNGELVGSNLATCWGSFGFFGPLTVRPDCWNQGIAQKLIEAVLALYKQRSVQQAGLFTFPASPKHHSLYQKFGFWPRFLTCILAKSVNANQPKAPEFCYSTLTDDQRLECLQASRMLTDTLYEGLDVTREIATVQALGLGDTLFLWDESGLAGLAICHIGARTEAGSHTCYVKFGAVRSGTGAEHRFEQLLDECERLAVTQQATRLLAGVNTSRITAYQQMLARGFRTEITGIAMHRFNEPIYNRPDVFALDDWR